MRVLPALVILSAPLLLLPLPVRAEMDRNACRLSADLQEQLAGVIRRHVQAIEGTPEPIALSLSARPDLRQKAQRAADAFTNYLASARGYLAATEDLAHQYRLCAR